jgi:hypothetical protein
LTTPRRHNSGAMIQGFWHRVVVTKVLVYGIGKEASSCCCCFSETRVLLTYFWQNKKKQLLHVGKQNNV